MKTALIGAAFAAMMGLAGTAHAMPVGAGAGDAADAGLTLVAQGCGPGFHRGPYGGCRPNFGPGPRRFVGERCVVRRTPWGVRRTCTRY